MGPYQLINPINHSKIDYHIPSETVDMKPTLNRDDCRHCGHEDGGIYEYCPKCQHNYSGAKFPEKITENELLEQSNLIGIIQNVFSGITLGCGMTIHETDLEGAYGEDIVRLNARSKDGESNWTEVPDWKLERFSSAISFLDKEGFRFYLPPLMIWCLKNGKGSNSRTFDSVISYLTSKDNYCKERFSGLNSEMNKCVSLFLEHINKFYQNITNDNYFFKIY